MERKINQEIAIKEIYFDKELYPRVSTNWQTIYDYSQSLLAGVVFPPITLAVLNGKKYLVDGVHRVESRKRNKKETVKAEIFTGWDKKRIFEEAIKRNISHGRVFSPFEKRRIALKLRIMKYPENQVSKIIQIPEDKLETFVAQRLVNTLTGEEIVKSEIKHIAGQEVEEDIKLIQQPMYNRSQISLLNEIIRLIEKNLLDLEDKKVQESLNRLKTLLFPGKTQTGKRLFGLFRQR